MAIQSNKYLTLNLQSATFPISVKYLDGHTYDYFWNKYLDFTLNSLDFSDNGILILPEFHEIPRSPLSLFLMNNNLVYEDNNAQDYTIQNGYRLKQANTNNYSSQDNNEDENGYYSYYSADLETDYMGRVNVLFKNFNLGYNILYYSYFIEGSSQWENLYLDIGDNAPYPLQFIATNSPFTFKLKKAKIRAKALNFIAFDTLIIEDSTLVLSDSLKIWNAKRVIIRNSTIYIPYLKDNSITSIEIIYNITNSLDGSSIPLYKKVIENGSIQILTTDVSDSKIEIVNSVIRTDGWRGTHFELNEIIPLLYMKSPNIVLDKIEFNYYYGLNDTLSFNINHPPIVIADNTYFVLKNSNINVKADITRDTVNIGVPNSYYPSIYQWDNNVNSFKDIFTYRYHDTVIYFLKNPKYITIKNNKFNLYNFLIIYDGIENYYNLTGIKVEGTNSDGTRRFGLNTGNLCMVDNSYSFLLNDINANLPQVFIFKNNNVEISGDVTNLLVNDFTLDDSGNYPYIFEQELVKGNASSVFNLSNLNSIIFNIVPQSLIEMQGQIANDVIPIPAWIWKFIRSSYFYGNKLNYQPKLIFSNNGSIYPDTTLYFSSLPNMIDVTTNLDGMNARATKLTTHFIEKTFSLPLIARTIPHAIGFGWKWNGTDWSKFDYDDNIEDII